MEDNKLIAEFMGVYSKEYGFDYYMLGNKGIKYHTSWDWLMPVVDKIESIEDEYGCAKYNVSVIQSFVEIIDNRNSEEIIVVDKDNRFDSTYAAVVDFIEWYNKRN